MTLQPPSNPNDLLQKCFLYQKNGEFEKAIDGYKKLLGIYPNNPQLLGSLGTVLLQKNQIKEGCYALEKSLKVDPNQPSIRLNLGLAYEQQNRFQEALLEFDRAIKLQPSFHEVYVRKAKLLMKLQQFESAIQILDQIISANQIDSFAFLDKGICLHHLDKNDDAIAVYNQALIQDPESPSLFNARGISELSLNRLEEALLSFEQSIAKNNFNPQPWNNRGLSLHRLNRFEEAIDSFDRALEIDPKYADAYSNRGLSLQALQKHSEALNDFNKSIELESGHADAHWNKALLKLQMGKFEEGWKLYEWRWKSFAKKWARNYKQPLWLGQFSLNNKIILVYPEQGYGDFIQFCRYIPLLRAQNAKVIVEVPDPLVRLAASLDADIEVVKTGDKLPHFDCQCPIMSLPLAFKTTLDNIPSTFPYLKAEPEKLESWQEKLGQKTKPRIGIAWSGSTHHKNDHNRSLNLEELLPLLELPFEFHLLQKEVRKEDELILNKTSIRNHQQDLNNFSDTAALIEMMDIIITVDTAVAHLAGALNKRVLLILPKNADYRWLVDTSTSPWYPSAQLFRQKTTANWQDLVKKVQINLLNLSL